MTENEPPRNAGPNQSSPSQAGQDRSPREWRRYGRTLRAARERLRNLNVDDPAIPGFLIGLTRIEERLRRPLRVVVLGEYNSGKTSVTGLILGKGLLPVSVLSNTGMPVHVGHGSEPALFGIDNNGNSIRIDTAAADDDDPLTDLSYRAIDLRLPLPWLQDHHILDTPATLTPAVFTADADIVIWCTVATRAWTESERNLWTSMPPRVRKPAILVATHKDSFYSDEDCEQVLRRLRSMTAGLFRQTVLISAASDDGNSEPPVSVSEDTALLLSAIDASAQMINERRLLKARRIVQRLARLTVHEFGRNAVHPESAAHLSSWQALTDRTLDDHRTGKLTKPQAVRALLFAFAHTAEALQPGVIHQTTTISPKPDSEADTPSTTAVMSGNTAMIRSDLTAVLRMLASTSRFESPQTREQREAARATLIALADLDTVFASLARWLTSAHASNATPYSNATA